MKAHPDRIAKGMYWDRAWSLVEGCEPVSEGCQNCWSAEQTRMWQFQKNPKVSSRYVGLVEDGKFNGRTRFMDQDIEKPRRVKTPQIWAIWNDLFYETVFTSELHDVFCAIQDCPQHIFLILTKRPESMIGSLTSLFTDIETGEFVSPWPFKNVALGVTVENDRHYGRIDTLLRVPAAVRFVSVEPCLGHVDLSRYLDRLDWVICGGESGYGGRPTHPDWVRELRDECVGHDVPFFFKQWGEWKPLYPQYGQTDEFVNFDDLAEIEEEIEFCNHEACLQTNGSIPVEGIMSIDHFRCDYQPMTWFNPWWMGRSGKKKAGRLLDGCTWDEFPRGFEK